MESVWVGASAAVCHSGTSQHLWCTLTYVYKQKKGNDRLCCRSWNASILLLTHCCPWLQRKKGIGVYSRSSFLFIMTSLKDCCWNHHSLPLLVEIRMYFYLCFKVVLSIGCPFFMLGACSLSTYQITTVVHTCQQISHVPKHAADH